MRIFWARREMTKADKQHFESYRAQTRAKHTILEKYIFAYFNIMKGTSEQNLVYIDGFAGRGTYDSEDGQLIPGSPLRALDRIASRPDLAAKVTTVFIEQDRDFFVELKAVVSSFHKENAHIREPIVENGSFAEKMNGVLNTLEQQGKTIAPAFVFVDPCGVDGVEFGVISRLLRSQRRCEVFLFFNIEGVRRILGLKDKMGPTLAHLLGSADRAKFLAAAVQANSDSSSREQTIIQYYERLLRDETPAKYVASFRVEKEDRRATSHYLIHASQHPRGFAIMKDVMLSVGQTAEGKGGLALEQASVSEMQMMFTPEWDAIKNSVLEALRFGAKPVSHFCIDLVERPDNRLCDRAYKTALLELEEERRIVVLDKQGRAPAPKRPRRHGMLTLGKDYYVRLA
jgi:three-Cys-motif partner protein